MSTIRRPIRIRWFIFCFMFAVGFVAYLQQKTLTIAASPMEPRSVTDAIADQLAARLVYRRLRVLPVPGRRRRRLLRRAQDTGLGRRAFDRVDAGHAGRAGAAARRRLVYGNAERSVSARYLAGRSLADLGRRDRQLVPLAALAVRARHSDDEPVAGRDGHAAADLASDGQLRLAARVCAGDAAGDPTGDPVGLVRTQPAAWSTRRSLRQSLPNSTPTSAPSRIPSRRLCHCAGA